MLEQTRLPPGSMLGDRYRIDRLLSTGAMGAVYAASHTLLHKPVAIKVLRTDIPGADQMVDRFRREAIAASGIGHENIVSVTDMGLGPNGTPYLVMELLEGCDLATAIEAEAPMPVERACDIAMQMLRGLGAAHEAGIVHRDLKPENLFLSRTPRGELVKILDFGVSLLERPDLPDGRLTSTGVAVGTPRYMSPEQASGEHHLTSAVDIYAAGVVIYEMLTGTLPYPGANYNVVIHQIIAGDWVPLEVRRPEVPHAVADAVDRALALEPGARFSSTDAMAAALEPFASSGAKSGAATEAASSWVRPAVLAAESDRSSEAFAATVNLKPGKSGATRRPLVQHDTFADPAWTEKKAAAPVSFEGSRVFDADPERELEARRRRSGRRATSLFLFVALAAAAAVAVVMLRRNGGESTPAAGIERAAAEPAADPPPQAAPEPPEPAEPPDEVAEPAPEPAKPAAAAADNEAKKDEGKKDEARAPDPEPKKSKSKSRSRSRSRSRSKSKSKSEAVEKKEHHVSREVRLSFLVLPRTASVTVRGVPVRGSSLEIERGSKAVPVAVRADGYVAKTLRVVPDRDREIVVSLQRKPQPAPAPAADEGAKADEPKTGSGDSTPETKVEAKPDEGAAGEAPAPAEPPSGGE